jgi:hypothetical protein
MTETFYLNVCVCVCVCVSISIEPIISVKLPATKNVSIKYHQEMSVPYDCNVVHGRNLNKGAKTLQEYFIVLHRIDVTDHSEMVYKGKAERKK